MKPIPPELIQQTYINTSLAKVKVCDYDHRKLRDVRALRQYLQQALTAVVEMENILQGTEAKLDA